MKKLYFLISIIMLYCSSLTAYAADMYSYPGQNRELISEVRVPNNFTDSQYEGLLSYTGVNFGYKLDLKGKSGIKLAVLGDSISTPFKISSFTKAYPYLLANMLDASRLSVYAVGGSRIGGMSHCQLVDRVQFMEKDADIILVLAGTNDFSSATPLGTVNDDTRETFYGSLNIMLDSLKERFPKGNIVLLSPIRRRGGASVNSFGYSLNDYMNAMSETASRKGITYHNLITKLVFDNTNNSGFLVDSLHPSEKGHYEIARCLYNELSRKG